MDSPGSSSLPWNWNKQSTLPRVCKPIFALQAHVEGCEVAGEATRALQCHEAWKGECSPGLVSRGRPRDQCEVDSVAAPGLFADVPAEFESDADGVQYCLHLLSHGLQDEPQVHHRCESFQRKWQPHSGLWGGSFWQRQGKTMGGKDWLKLTESLQGQCGQGSRCVGCQINRNVTHPDITLERLKLLFTTPGWEHSPFCAWSDRSHGYPQKLAKLPSSARSLMAASETALSSVSRYSFRRVDPSD